MRSIDGLKMVEFLKERPVHIPENRCKRAVQRAGLNFENDVMQRLAHLAYDGHPIFDGRSLKVIAGQWFRFLDRNGFGFAQADLIAVVPEKKLCLLIECKRTHTERGLEQLENLYGPLLERGLGAGWKVLRLLVCQHLTAKVERSTLQLGWNEWLSKVAWLLSSGSPVPTMCLQWRKGWN